MRVRAFFFLITGIAAPLGAQNTTGSVDSVSAGAMVAEAKKLGPPAEVLTLTASLSERTITVRQGDSVVNVLSGSNRRGQPPHANRQLQDQANCLEPALDPTR